MNDISFGCDNYLLNSLVLKVCFGPTKIVRFGWTYIVFLYQDPVAGHAPRYLRMLVATPLQVLPVGLVWVVLETLMLELMSHRQAVSFHFTYLSFLLFQNKKLLFEVNQFSSVKACSWLLIKSIICLYFNIKYHDNHIMQAIRITINHIHISTKSNYFLQYFNMLLKYKIILFMKTIIISILHRIKIKEIRNFIIVVKPTTNSKASFRLWMLDLNIMNNN